MKYYLTCTLFFLMCAPLFVFAQVRPTLNWGTYYGSGDVQATCLAYGDSGCVYMAGFTTGTTNIATPGAYSTTFSGGDDVFLAKFDSTGAIRWATYYGGAGSDEAYSIVYDGAGNVYLSGLTTSTSGIATPGTHQSAYGGGIGDAFLAKFNSAGSLVWGTYYGGSGSDISYGDCIDNSGHVYITGYTYSVDSIATPGAFETTSGDTTNASGFIAKFNDSGAVIWATYYGGDDDVEPVSIGCDDTGNVYVAGTTASTTGISTPGAFQLGFHTDADDDGFIVKLNSQGLRQWGTYFGAFGSNELDAMICDGVGNIYLTGSTYCTDSIATPGAYQSTLLGVADAYLTKFNSAGAIQWGTYYGTGTEEGNALAADGAGNVYMAGATASAAGIATPGAFQSAYAGDIDAFIAVFNTTGTLEWATYYGGPNYDEGFGAATDGNGHIYISGATHSTSGIATTGAYDTSYSAAALGYGGFLARFGPADVNLSGVSHINGAGTNVFIYPNPANDMLYISWQGGTNSRVQLSIMDMEGQVIMATTLPAFLNSQAISIANLPDGNYIGVLQANDIRVYKKITVIR